MKPKIDAGFRRRIIALAVIAVLILGIFVLRLAKFQLISSPTSSPNSFVTSSLATEGQNS